MLSLDFADIFARISDASIEPGDFCGDSASNFAQEIKLIIEDLEEQVIFLKMILFYQISFISIVIELDKRLLPSLQIPFMKTGLNPWRHM